MLNKENAQSNTNAIKADSSYPASLDGWPLC